MPIAAETLALLTTFAQLVTVETTGNDGGAIRSGTVPGDLRSDPTQPEGITLSGEEYHAYADALEALLDESTLEHLDRRDVDSALWRLGCDLILRRSEYADSATREERVREFAQSIERLHEEYEVIVPITELRLPKGSVTIGPVTLERFTSRTLAAWGYEVDEMLRRAHRQLVRQPVARVRVWAGSTERATDRANAAIDTALDLLRTASFGFRSLIHDEQLLQRRGSGRAVKLVKEGRVVRQGMGGLWGPHVRSLGLTLAGDLLDTAKAAGERYAPLFDGTIPQSMADPLIRALEWAGSAVTAERFDDKIVHSCTALESFLTTPRDRQKSGAICLRLMLLGEHRAEGFPWPGEPHVFYGLRNDVVHGSARNVCTRQDYLRLRQIVSDAIRQTITGVLVTPGVTSPAELIHALEVAPHLQACLHGTCQ